MTVENVNQLKVLSKQQRSVLVKYDKFLQMFAKRQGHKIIKLAKKKTPVDTGRLRNSYLDPVVRRDGEAITITISNNAKYSLFVEFGYRVTSRSRITGGKRGKNKKGKKKKKKKTASALGYVEGKYMVRNAIISVQKTMHNDFRKASNVFWKRVGGLK